MSNTMLNTCAVAHTLSEQTDPGQPADQVNTLSQRPGYFTLHQFELRSPMPAKCLWSCMLVTEEFAD